MALVKVAGTAFIKVDGVQYALQGNATVKFSTSNREVMVGADGVHGYKETPTAPSIEMTLTRTPDCSLATLSRMTDSTVTLEAADGKVYVLNEAFQSGDLDYAATEGTVGVTFVGRSINEL